MKHPVWIMATMFALAIPFGAGAATPKSAPKSSCIETRSFVATVTNLRTSRQGTNRLVTATVRFENEQTLTTDGPFVAVKEALGGYLFYEADNLDAAIELASRIPAARLGGAVEIRPFKET